MRSLVVFLGSFVGLALLSACNAIEAEPVGMESSSVASQEALRGVILPHHNLVGNYIDEIYENLDVGDIDRILLLSPNHFDEGYNFIQSTDKLDADVVLDDAFIGVLADKDVLAIEETGLNAEHGVMIHAERIEQFFPEVPLVPVMIKWQTPQARLDDFMDAVVVDGGLDRTLVIASIDFSHYLLEETAVKNDDRTINWLQSWGNGDIGEVILDDVWSLEKSFNMDTASSTGMDSPESFYLFVRLLDSPENVEIWKRTSSHSLYGAGDPMENTSHIFVKVR